MPRLRSRLLLGVVLVAGCRKPPPPIADTDGPALYARYCALCHGPEAKGYAADNAPSLVSTTFAATASEAFLRASIERGRPGTAMAAYAQPLGGPLNPTQIASIVAFLRRGAPPPIELPAAASVGDAAKGKSIFEAQCTRCHGSPTQRGEAVHLFNTNLLTAASDGFLRYAVMFGRPGTKMEGWSGKLDWRSIDDVVAYLRSFAPLPAAAQQPPPPIPPAPPPPALEAALPLKGPIVINPKGPKADFKLQDDRLLPLDDLKAALDAKKRVVIVDARAPSDWLRLHIPGSVSIPYYDLTGLDRLPTDGTWIIAYCACPHHASGVVVTELRKRNYKHSAVLDEGIFAWQRKGYPVVAAAGALPVPAPPPLRPTTILPSPPLPTATPLPSGFIPRRAAPPATTGH